MTPLRSLSQLEFLSLTGATKVRDVSPLRELRKLKRPYVEHTCIVDLEPLSGLGNLKILNVEGTPVAVDEIKAIQNALPGCKIAGP